MLRNEMELFVKARENKNFEFQTPTKTVFSRYKFI